MSSGIRTQRHFRPGPTGFLAWDVGKLIVAAERLPILNWPLEKISELDERWWYQFPQEVPTPRSIGEHMKLVNAVDLSYPVLLCAEGRLMDGMHRCLKALLEGRETVLARQFPQTPPPDETDHVPDFSEG